MRVEKLGDIELRCQDCMRVPSMRLYVKDVYDNVIGYIEELIRLKSFNKEYLEE